ncbi:MAG: hypothetical protein GF334_13175 [Candidatus Altiarchaeales archaeon]|nr:hypothetical protein [Candidatus Altiarchaeales archaeon]
MLSTLLVLGFFTAVGFLLILIQLRREKLETIFILDEKTQKIKKQLTPLYNLRQVKQKIPFDVRAFKIGNLPFHTMFLRYRHARLIKKPHILQFLGALNCLPENNCTYTSTVNSYYPANPLSNCLNKDPKMMRLLTESNIYFMQITCGQSIDFKDLEPKRDQDSMIVEFRWDGENLPGFYVKIMRILEHLYTHCFDLMEK